MLAYVGLSIISGESPVLACAGHIIVGESPMLACVGPIIIVGESTVLATSLPANRLCWRVRSLHRRWRERILALVLVFVYSLVCSVVNGAQGLVSRMHSVTEAIQWPNICVLINRPIHVSGQYNIIAPP